MMEISLKDSKASGNVAFYLRHAVFYSSGKSTTTDLKTSRSLRRHWGFFGYFCTDRIGLSAIYLHLVQTPHFIDAKVIMLSWDQSGADGVRARRIQYPNQNARQAPTSLV